MLLLVMLFAIKLLAQANIFKRKGLVFFPTPSFINEADLNRNFANFLRKMRYKWCYSNDITEYFSETPAF